MKFLCVCKNTIRDQTDNLPYKATIIPDQFSESMWEAFGEAVALSPPINQMEQDKLGGRVFAVVDSLTGYQCQECGRLFIEKNGSIYLFSPEDDNVPKNLFERHG